MIEQAESRLLAGAGAGAFENDPLGLAQPVFLGEGLDRHFEVARRHLLGIERERGALPGNGGKFFLVDVDRDDDAAHGGRDLRGITADAADAVDDDQIALLDAGLHDRLVGRGHGIGDHRQIGQIDSDAGQAVLVDHAQPVRRHDDVRGKAALNIVARHLLVRADRRLAALAGVAVAARDHRRNNNRAVGEPERIRAGVDDVAADLVPERQRQFVLGAHAVVIIAKIGVADAAAGDFDQDFIGARACRFRIPSGRKACRRRSSSNELAWRSSVCPPEWPLSPSPDLHAALAFILRSATAQTSLIKVKEKPNKRILVLKYILEADAREMGSNQGIMAMAASPSISIAIVGSGGAGALTTVDSLLETAAAAGWHGLFTRTMGPQIRGGEAAGLLRLAVDPVECLPDQFDLMIGIDWLNAAPFRRRNQGRTADFGDQRSTRRRLAADGDPIRRPRRRNPDEGDGQGHPRRPPQHDRARHRRAAARLYRRAGLRADREASGRQGSRQPSRRVWPASRSASAPPPASISDCNSPRRSRAPPSAGCCRATRRPRSAPSAAAFALPPPIRSRRRPKSSNGWRRT